MRLRNPRPARLPRHIKADVRTHMKWKWILLAIATGLGQRGSGQRGHVSTRDICASTLPNVHYRVLSICRLSRRDPKDLILPVLVSGGSYVSCFHERSSYRGLAPHLQRAHAGRTPRPEPYRCPARTRVNVGLGRTLWGADESCKTQT